MKRTQIYLSKQQLIKLKQQAKKIGISKSEFIRRIIDLYFEEREKNDK